jgi:hypothetical protein
MIIKMSKITDIIHIKQTTRDNFNINNKRGWLFAHIIHTRAQPDP